MEWYYYVACFFAGVFFTNAVPHFVQGVSGNRFPTPFAHPPGRGLSSPRVNVLWAFCNLAMGALMVWAGKFSLGNTVSIIVGLAGAAAMSIRLSYSLSKKETA